MSLDGTMITVVETTPLGSLGSMARYGRLVADALRSRRGGPRDRVLRLGLPEGCLKRLPSRLATWVHHGWLATAGIRRVGLCREGLVHVVDGSHAYVAREVDPERLVVTCHDVIPMLQMKGFLPGSPGRAARHVVKASLDVLARAAGIIADSACTRDDLCRVTGVAAGRVVVVAPALDPVWSASPGGHHETGPGTRYLLHVGGDSPYKNRGGVLSIFEQVLQTCDVELVLAGQGPGETMRRRLAGSHAANRVRFVHHPSDDQLRDLYSGAALLLFPSLYEGFGWPVLEAMACGCPVVCSNAASLPEVAGDAALTAFPEDVTALASHCVRILKNPDVASRLSVSGRKRADGYTLDQFGAELASVYERLVRKGAGPCL